MPTPFTIAGFAIAKIRNRYRVFALNEGCMGPNRGVRVHAWLREVEDRYSADRAFSQLQAVVSSHADAPWSIEGHHAGATRCVSGGCDDRFCSIGHAIYTAGRGIDSDFVGTTSMPLATVATISSVNLCDPDPLAAAAARTPRVPVEFPAGTFGAAPPRGAPAPGIRSFGVELECIVPLESLPAINALAATNPRMAVKGDGSIRTPSPRYHPREILFWSTDFEEMGVWLRKMYDEFGVRTNDSCGFHIHVRPVKAHAWRFATRSYFEEFYAAYGKLAAQQAPKYAARLGSRWCLPLPWSASLVRRAGEGRRLPRYPAPGYDARYQAINLDSLPKCRKQTIEHRILPHQETAAEAAESVRWLVTSASEIAMTRLTIDAETAQVLSNLPATSRLHHDFAPDEIRAAPTIAAATTAPLAPAMEA